MVRKNPGSERRSPAFDAFKDYVRLNREQQFKELADSARRRGIAARKRSKTFATLAAASGVDLDAIRDLHAKEWQAVLKQVEKTAKPSPIDKQERHCQRLALSTINKHRDRFEYQKGNPHTSLCRWSAVSAPSVSIVPQTFNDGLVTLVIAPVAPPVQSGRNMISTRVRVRANLSHLTNLVPAAAVDIFTSQVFEALVPHDGVLSVVANYSPLGNIFLGAPGDCILPGSASAEVNLFMFVEVETAAGDQIELPLGATSTIVDRDIDATCDGANRMVRVGTSNGVAFQLTHNDIISVEAGDLVRVTAGIEVFLATAVGGAAEAIFAPLPFGFNVPMVMFKIDN